MVYVFDTVTSTNDVAREGQYVHGDIIRAEYQTAGRGQRGHAWTSAAGQNLMFSAVLCPAFLPVNEQFLLSEAVALSLTDTFASFGIDTRIKWTNDIYAGDRKLTGVLIEQNVSGGTISRSVVGIGINVNQTVFDPSLPNPVSMAQLLGRTVDRDEVLSAFLGSLGERYARLEHGDRQALSAEYRSRMYRLAERHAYRLADGSVFEGEIRGVRPSGALVVARADGSEDEYSFGQIEFIIPRGCAFGK